MISYESSTGRSSWVVCQPPYGHLGHRRCPSEFWFNYQQAWGVSYGDPRCLQCAWELTKFLKEFGYALATEDSLVGSSDLPLASGRLEFRGGSVVDWWLSSACREIVRAHRREGHSLEIRGVPYYYKDAEMHLCR